MNLIRYPEPVDLTGFEEADSAAAVGAGKAARVTLHPKKSRPAGLGIVGKFCGS